MARADLPTRNEYANAIPFGASSMSYFQSRRSAVIARKGAVATSQPLAAQAGLQMLKDGGNAVDAAVATAAVLNVVEPTSTGIGGDMFALIWDKNERKVIALNGSGRQAAAANVDDVRKAGYDSIPNNGPGSHFAVSVPGTVDGWETALNRYGRMTLREVLQPAIDYALNGYAVSEVIANGWQSAESAESVESPLVGGHGHASRKRGERQFQHDGLILIRVNSLRMILLPSLLAIKYLP